jgi:hypothetical protein
MTADPAAAAPDQRYAAFRHGAFLRYWTARFLGTFATQIVSVAVGWQMYDLTRDPFDLGLVVSSNSCRHCCWCWSPAWSPTVSADARSWRWRPRSRRCAPRR